jgi:hypothetical protein
LIDTGKNTRQRGTQVNFFFLSFSGFAFALPSLSLTR